MAATVRAFHIVNKWSLLLVVAKDLFAPKEIQRTLNVMLSLIKDVLSKITAVPVWWEQILEENSETDLI